MSCCTNERLQESYDLESEFAQARSQSLDEALKEDLLDVLEKIYQEKEEKGLEVDMWCHFGRVYFTGIDEGISDKIVIVFSFFETKMKSRCSLFK